MLVSKARMQPLSISVIDTFTTPLFWAPFTAWMLAQCTKMLCSLVQTHKLDFSFIVSTGGMPSAHSSMVASLTTAMGVTQGFTSPPYIVALAFTLIVMFDAATVRRAAGQQARLLNQIVNEILKEHRLPEYRKLREMLGHTRLEVLMGMIMGILVALLVVAIPLLLHPERGA